MRCNECGNIMMTGDVWCPFCYPPQPLDEGKSHNEDNNSDTEKG